MENYFKKPKGHFFLDLGVLPVNIHKAYIYYLCPFLFTCCTSIKSLPKGRRILVYTYIYIIIIFVNNIFSVLKIFSRPDFGIFHSVIYQTFCLFSVPLYHHFTKGKLDLRPYSREAKGISTSSTCTKP